MSNHRLPPSLAALLAALPAILLVAQAHLTCGVVYSLDDPYIHLALARQILHGHYGINPGEFAAPSSSILWPFLLAPFAFTRLVEFLPLVINLAALLVAVSLMRERQGWPFWLSVVLLPLIRYEGLAISLPVLAYLALSPGRRASAFAAGAIVVGVVGGFSFVL